jgi:hypothetical protein
MRTARNCRILHMPMEWMNEWILKTDISFVRVRVRETLSFLYDIISVEVFFSLHRSCVCDQYKMFDCLWSHKHMTYFTSSCTAHCFPCIAFSGPSMCKSFR